MAQTKVVLLERIETLGNLGDVVAVKPGYARNYLLPQKKALRANQENIAYFEAQRKTLEAENEKRKKDAEKLAKKLGGLKVPLIRQAAEGGQLYGSVTARDIAAEVASATGEKIERSMVQLNQSFKMIGLFPVALALHPEVKVDVTINIARSEEEAETQARTGKALIVEEGQSAAAPAKDAAEEQLAEVLEDSALEAEKEKKKTTKSKESAETPEAAPAADEEEADGEKKAKSRKKPAAKKEKAKEKGADKE